MKKDTLAVFVLLFISVITQAQFELNSSGEAGIGATPISGIDFYTPEAKVSYLAVNTAPVTTCRFLCNGRAIFQSSTASAFEFSAWDYGEMELLPTSDNQNRIGSPDLQFYKIYGRYIYQNGSQVTSDLRQKENIENLQNSLEKLKMIRGVKFDFKTPEGFSTDQERKEKLDYLDKNRFGFIAQEIMEVFPNLVKLEEDSELYSVDYLGIIPILVEAIKEQQEIIESLQSQVTTISDDNEAIKRSATSSSETINRVIKSTLSQNSPNPFTEETRIDYFLEEGITSAFLYIHDLTGKQILNYQLKEKGNGIIRISGRELDPGMYFYTLVADNKEIDTRRMLLTE